MDASWDISPTSSDNSDFLNFIYVHPQMDPQRVTYWRWVYFGLEWFESNENEDVWIFIYLSSLIFVQADAGLDFYFWDDVLEQYSSVM